MRNARGTIFRPKRGKRTEGSKNNANKLQDPKTWTTMHARIKTAPIVGLIENNYKHLFKFCNQGGVLRELNSLAKSTRKRTQMVHTGVHKENMTCLRESLAYNECEQRWACNICNRAEKPKDIQNMTQRTFWRARMQTATKEETRSAKQNLSHMCHRCE